MSRLPIYLPVYLILSALISSHIYSHYLLLLQNDIQAMSRSHRIGQTKKVNVYRLLTSKTYEMHMFHTASVKLGLDYAVVQHSKQMKTGGGGEAGLGEDSSSKKSSSISSGGGTDLSLSNKQLENLLRFGNKKKTQQL